MSAGRHCVEELRRKYVRDAGRKLHLRRKRVRHLEIDFVADAGAGRTFVTRATAVPAAL